MIANRRVAFTVAALDSAPELTGWATIDDGRILRRGASPVRCAADVEAVADQVLALGADLVVVEGVFVGKNADTALQLAELVGAWKQTFGLRGRPVRTVLASEWQREILGCSPRAKRDERKALAVAWVERNFGGVKVGHDIADAVCLAVWGARQLEREALGRAGTATGADSGHQRDLVRSGEARR